MAKETRDDSLPFRAMVRLPADLGAEVERLARRELMPTAVLLRRLIKDGIERMKREGS